MNFAKGGVELIWVEGEMLEGGQITDEAVAFGKSLAEECASYGAHLGYQWAQSAAVATMTAEEIAQAQDKAVAIAQGIKTMGFEAMEINAAGFNMGAHFLSRFHNTRTDEYGMDSLENRARFVVECIQKIKQTCGDDFVVQVLIERGGIRLKRPGFRLSLVAYRAQEARHHGHAESQRRFGQAAISARPALYDHRAVCVGFAGMAWGLKRLVMDTLPLQPTRAPKWKSRATLS